MKKLFIYYSFTGNGDAVANSEVYFEVCARSGIQSSVSLYPVIQHSVGVDPDGLRMPHYFA